MRKKVICDDPEINRIKEHISGVFPHAHRVDIKVKKIPNEGYKSLIEVSIPPKKRLIALKKDNNIRKSLERSHLAIIKQLHKVKRQWSRSNNKKIDLFGVH